MRQAAKPHHEGHDSLAVSSLRSSVLLLAGHMQTQPAALPQQQMPQGLCLSILMEAQCIQKCKTRHECCWPKLSLVSLVGVLPRKVGRVLNWSQNLLDTVCLRIIAKRRVDATRLFCDLTSCSSIRYRCFVEAVFQVFHKVHSHQCWSCKCLLSAAACAGPPPFQSQPAKLACKTCTIFHERRDVHHIVSYHLLYHILSYHVM